LICSFSALIMFFAQSKKRISKGDIG
jgi:hypothetical protein